MARIENPSPEPQLADVSAAATQFHQSGHSRI